MKAIRKLIRADGAETELHGPHAIRDVCQMIGAEALDTVRLADRVHVMLVDDDGISKGLPVNPAATRLYQDARGVPHQIRGDVVIVPDSDYARYA
ncbi:hypothetical protein LMG3410_04836 [Achromobacter aegrifaciens]|uniref:DUF3846 domain-containing protein n=1 Tax=Achromobacter aegrifaciens TaxID=1287736 RepID=UPI00146561D8|nr:hypothetical protein [Achromobacter aegrifaciens]CAB3911145.1 hypothetical protein LMG3410_04836 [Achromobacter aegrifaciens]